MYIIKFVYVFVNLVARISKTCGTFVDLTVCIHMLLYACVTTFEMDLSS